MKFKFFSFLFLLMTLFSVTSIAQNKVQFFDDDGNPELVTPTICMEPGFAFLSPTMLVDGNIITDTLFINVMPKYVSFTAKSDMSQSLITLTDTWHWVAKTKTWETVSTNENWKYRLSYTNECELLFLEEIPAVGTAVHYYVGKP